MAIVSTETLIKVRDMLSAYRGRLHNEVDASTKEEIGRAIAELDDLIESDCSRHERRDVLWLLSKLIDKLPWIVRLMNHLE